jgi:hypothetical protein
MSPITTEQAARFAPLVSFHVNEKYFPCSIDWLLEHAELRKTDDSFRIQNPTQADLAEFSAPEYYLDVHARGFPGEPLVDNQVAAPMYVAAQEWDDCIEITYVMLYAYQGGQTCRALKWLDHFNAIINDYGKHQGDLEWISVLVSKDYRQVLSIGFASHGEMAYYAPGDCLMEGDHPRVRVALNGHASYNGKGKNPNDWVFSYELPTVFGTIDLFTEQGVKWEPHHHPQEMLTIIGLDQHGTPVSDQQWARFRGRLGIRQRNDFTSATEVDGSPLSSGHQAFTGLIITAGKVTGQIPDSLRDGVGPEGPGARDFVQGLQRQGNRLWRFDVGNTGCDASAGPGVVAYAGKLHMLYRDSGGNGLMHLVSRDGKKWDRARQHHPDATTSEAPCAIVHENRLHVFVRDGNGNGILHLVSDTPDGESLQHAAPYYIGLDCDEQPSAASLHGKLCVVGRDQDRNGIMYAIKAPGAGWTKGYTGCNTSAAPAIIAYGGRLHVFYRDHHGNGIMHIVSDDGIKWHPAAIPHPPYTTGTAIGVVETDHELHLFFRDGQKHATGVLHLVSNNGEHFVPASPGWFIGMKCNSAPSATQLHGKICVLATNYQGNAVMRALSY